MTHDPRYRATLSAIEAEIHYDDSIDSWIVIVREYDQFGCVKVVRSPDPLACTGYSADRLQYAIDHFAGELGLDPEEFTRMKGEPDSNEAEYTAFFYLDFRRRFELAGEDGKWSVVSLPANQCHRPEHGVPEVLAFQAPSALAAGEFLRATFSERDGFEYLARTQLSEDVLLFFQPAETYADCPCGERLTIGRVLCPLSLQSAYDVLQVCPSCDRSAAHCNSRTGEIYSWMSRAALDHANATLDAMQYDADCNEFGGDDW